MEFEQFQSYMLQTSKHYFTTVHKVIDNYFSIFLFYDQKKMNMKIPEISYRREFSLVPNFFETILNY
jgi:hypothetical protein